MSSDRGASIRRYTRRAVTIPAQRPQLTESARPERAGLVIPYDEALAELEDAIAADDVAERLEGPPVESVFRRP